MVSKKRPDLDADLDDNDADLDPGGPVFGQSYVPVLGAIERADGDFRVTGTGFGLRLRLRASASGMAWVELAVVFISV